MGTALPTGITDTNTLLCSPGAAIARPLQQGGFTACTEDAIEAVGSSCLSLQPSVPWAAALPDLQHRAQPLSTTSHRQQAMISLLFPGWQWGSGCLLLHYQHWVIKAASCPLEALAFISRMSLWTILV